MQRRLSFILVLAAMNVLAWTAAIAVDCNSNGVADDVDIGTPVLRADLPVRFGSGFSWGQPLAEDLNGDGRLDLTALVGPEDGRNFAVWTNLGGGRFDAVALYTTQTGGRWAAAADLDGDGDVDLATVVSWNSWIRLLFNDGAGRFPESTGLYVDRSMLFIGAADFDGDGRIDLVTGHRNGATVHLNGGEAAFAVTREVGPQDPVQHVAFADVDGDGDLDLALVPELSRGKTVLLSNRGDAAFDVSATLEIPGQIAHAVLADLDGDGDPDLATARSEAATPVEGTLGLYMNHGAWVIGAEVTHRFPGTPSYMAVAQVRGDGHPDLLVSSKDLLLFRSDGDGHVARPQVLDLATSVGVFVVRDLDGNGTPELWTSKYNEPDSLGTVALAVAPWSMDCDADGVPDECGSDCNQNRRADSCDAADGPDCNQDGIVDSCEADCNQNGTPDDCDLKSGKSEDCNLNSVPDECEPADCNSNGLPDVCDLAAARSMDCNSNGRPDECEFDCNSSGRPDDCDVARGSSPDANGNSIPDECEVRPSFLYDFEETGSGLGAPGGKARLEVTSRIHILGLEPGIAGTQGWSVLAVATGCVPISVTTAGTVAADFSEGPPGMFKQGFRHTRLVNRQELERIGLTQDAGYTSAIVLSFVEPVSLDPAGSPYPMLRAMLEGMVPRTGCVECLVEYVNWRNADAGAGGSGGLPGDNAVTFRGETVYARREGMTVRFCEARFHRGDSNGDGRNDVSDAVTLFSFLFLGGPRPECLEAANTDDSPQVDITDGIFLLTFLYLGGTPPPPPGAPSRADCGPDTGGPQGNLGCEHYNGCD